MARYRHSETQMKLTILFFFPFFISVTPLFAQEYDTPNIIYILADDMGIGDVKAYNNEAKFPTPHIDQMVREGVKFTDAHTSSSVCTPTRYGILTGRYAWRTHLKKGVTHGLTEHLIDTKRTTVARYLKMKGYATAVIGKWHLGMDWHYTYPGKVDKFGTNLNTQTSIQNGPNSLGFDYYYGISASLNMSPHAYIENDKLLGDNLKLIKDSNEIKNILGFGAGKPGWLDLNFKRDEVLETLTNKAIGWMNRIKKQSPNKPFFLYLPLNAPHSPIAPSSKFIGKSKLSLHADFCIDVDNTVGQIIGAVESLGITENTIIIFTSDNGVSPQAKLKTMQEQGHFSSYIYRGLKGTLYEGGHRVPFIVKWPKIIKDSIETDYLTCTTDFIATVAHLFDDILPENIGEDSVSFLPVLLGEDKNDIDRGGIVHHSDAGFFAIRKGKWKLIFHENAGSRRVDPKDKPLINPGEIQLFNMETDAIESTNVAAQHIDIVEDLKKLMAKFINEGRSTVGKSQKNDPTPKGWKNVSHFESYLKIN